MKEIRMNIIIDIFIVLKWEEIERLGEIGRDWERLGKIERDYERLERLERLGEIGRDWERS